MDEFKKMMVLVWEYGKYYFNNPPQTPDQFGELTEMANGILKLQKPNTKEYTFVKNMLIATNDYIDSDWREKNLK